MNQKLSSVKERSMNVLVTGKRYTFRTPQPSPRIKDCGNIVEVPIISLIDNVSASTLSSSYCPVSSLPIKCPVQNSFSSEMDPITETYCANVASIDDSELPISDRWPVPIPNSPRRSFHHSLYPLWPDAMTSCREAVPSPLTNQPLLGTKVPLHYRCPKLGKASCLACVDVVCSNGSQLKTVINNTRSPQLTTDGLYKLSVGVNGKSSTTMQDRVACNGDGFADIELSPKNSPRRSLQTEQITISGVVQQTKLVWLGHQEKGVCGETTLKTSNVKTGISSTLMGQTILGALFHKPWRAGQRRDPRQVSQVHFPFIRQSLASQKRKKKKKNKKNKQQKKKNDSLEETTHDQCCILGKGDTCERHTEPSSDIKSAEQTRCRNEVWEGKMKSSGLHKNGTHKSNAFSEKMATAVLIVEEGLKTNYGSKESSSEAINASQSYSIRLEEDTAKVRDTSLVRTDIESPILCTFSDKLGCNDRGRCEEACLEVKVSADTAIFDSDSPGQLSSHNSASRNAMEPDSPKTDVQLNRNGARQNQRCPSNSGRKRKDGQVLGPGCRSMHFADTINQELLGEDVSSETSTQETIDLSETEGPDNESPASEFVWCSSDGLQAAGIRQSASSCSAGREKQGGKICRSTRSNTYIPTHARRARNPDQTKSGQVCSLPMLCKALEERISCSRALKSDPITLLTAVRDLNPFIPTGVPLETGVRDFLVEKHRLKDNEYVEHKSSVEKTLSSVGEEVTSKDMHAGESKQANAKDISWLPFIHVLPEGTQEGCCLYQVIETGQMESSNSQPVHSPAVCSLPEHPVSRPSKAATSLGNEKNKKKQQTTSQDQNRNKAKRSLSGTLGPSESSMRGRGEIIKTIGDTGSGKTPTKGANGSSSAIADFRKSRNQPMNEKQSRNGSFPTISTEASINSSNTKRSKLNLPISKILPTAKQITLPCAVINVRLNRQAASRGHLAHGAASSYEVENYSELNELKCHNVASAIGRHNIVKTEVKESTELTYNSFNRMGHLINPEEHDFSDVSCIKTKSAFKSNTPYWHVDAIFASDGEMKPKDQLNNVHNLKYLAFKALEVTTANPQVCTITNEREFGLGASEGLFSLDSIRNNRNAYLQSAHEVSCNEHREILNDLEKRLGYVTPNSKSMEVSEPAFSDSEKSYSTSDRILKDLNPANVCMDSSGPSRRKWSANKHVTTPSSPSFHTRSVTVQEDNPIIKSVLAPISPSLLKPNNQDIGQGYRRPSSVTGIYGRDSNGPHHVVSRNEHIESGPDLTEETTSLKQVIAASDTSCDSFAKTRTLLSRKPLNAEKLEMDPAELGGQWGCRAKHHQTYDSLTDPQRRVLVSTYVQLGGAKRSKTEVDFLKMARKRSLGDISVSFRIPLYYGNSRKGKVTPSWKWVLNSRNRRRVPLQLSVTDANMSIRGTNVGKVWHSSSPTALTN